MIDLEHYDGGHIPKHSIIVASFGGSLIFIEGHKIKNPSEHLSKARVSKKVEDGVYEISLAVEKDIKENRPKFSLRNQDLTMVAPLLDKKSFVGVLKDEAGPERMAELFAALIEADPTVQSLIIMAIGDSPDNKATWSIGMLRYHPLTAGDQTVELVTDTV